MPERSDRRTARRRRRAPQTSPRSGTSNRMRPMPGDHRDVEEGDQRPGQQLADHQLDAAHRADLELLLRAQVPLPDEGDRRLLHRDDRDDHHHQAGDEEVGRTAARGCTRCGSAAAAGRSWTGRGPGRRPSRRVSSAAVQLVQRHRVRLAELGRVRFAAVDEDGDLRRVRSERQGPLRSRQGSRSRRARCLWSNASSTSFSRAAAGRPPRRRRLLVLLHVLLARRGLVESMTIVATCSTSKLIA